MHEASIATAILTMVEQALKNESPPPQVSRLVIEYGALAGVELRALEFSLSALQLGTVLEGATIEYQEQSGQAWCFTCDKTVAIYSRLDSCPDCAGTRLQATGGTEVTVKELFVKE